jgi:hypothetical protein
VLKQGELEKRTSLPEKAVASAWNCPICGNPQNTHYDRCPECSVIAARFQDDMATTQQLGAIEAQQSPSPGKVRAPLTTSNNLSKRSLYKVKEVLRSPYGLAITAIAALIGFVIGVVLTSSIGPLK